VCRNIRPLLNYEPATTRDEVHAAAVQNVRKVSGMQKPSHENERAFDQAVEAVTAVTERLLAELVTSAPPKDRDLEAERRQPRAAVRFGAERAVSAQSPAPLLADA
jgi:hypothetical protein